MTCTGTSLSVGSGCRYGRIIWMIYWWKAMWWRSMAKGEHDEVIEAEIKVRQVAPKLSGVEFQGALAYEIQRRRQEKSTQINWGLNDRRNELSIPVKGRGSPKVNHILLYLSKVMTIVMVMEAMEKHGCVSLAEAKRKVARDCKARGIKDKKGRAIDYDKVRRDYKNAKDAGFCEQAAALLSIFVRKIALIIVGSILAMH